MKFLIFVVILAVPFKGTASTANELSTTISSNRVTQNQDELNAALSNDLGCKYAEALGLRGQNATAVIGPSYSKANESLYYNKAILKCFISGQKQDTQTNKIWYGPDGKLMAFDENVVKHSERIIVSFNQNEMSLQFTSVKLGDEGKYVCGLSGETTEGSVTFTVNQLPVISMQQYREPVVENSIAVVATCFANFSKPLPTMWFENSKGERVDNLAKTIAMPKANETDLPSLSLDLKKVFTRLDNHETFMCMVSHEDFEKPLSIPTGEVTVHFPASAEFVESSLQGSYLELQEDDSFEALCMGIGSPQPEIKWNFVPDVQMTLPPISEETKLSDIPVSEEVNNKIPSNFMVSSNGNKIISTSLKATSEDVTNNGTFTCTASNGVGSPSTISFHIGVYDKPTTPPPPTTPAQSHGAGSGFAAPTTTMSPTVDAAVIGGVVAVAVFVLIVTIIILMRYFLAHKGEYYTNELKRNDDLEEVSVSDDDDLPTTEAELLGEKKRTEHFL